MILFREQIRLRIREQIRNQVLDQVRIQTTWRQVEYGILIPISNQILNQVWWQFESKIRELRREILNDNI